MYFKNLKINKEWQQFRSIDIDFHDKLTILTGANASGKTTILNLLARHYGWQSVSYATPFKDKLKMSWKWVMGQIFGIDDGQQNVIGELSYSNGSTANLVLPHSNTPTYNIEIQNQQSLDCFFIPSHRPIFNYQKVENIPTTNISNKEQAYQKVSECNRNHYFGGSGRSFNYHIKETLIAWNVFGLGNRDLEPNEEYIGYFDGFQEILSKILPKSLGFRKLAIRNFEVVMECNTGDFMIDGSSGGISALIEIGWQVFMFDNKTDKEFTVLIDELENHLHPTMQRQVLPDLLSAFPNARFVVSTHSPLIVGSVKDSNVYALRYQNVKVVSEKLDLVNKPKTATEILDEVLGVSFSMPIWAEEELNKIIEKYGQSELNKKNIGDLRNELTQVGLERLIPESVIKLIDKENDKN
jgi:predicted ATPase